MAYEGQKQIIEVKSAIVKDMDTYFSTCTNIGILALAYNRMKSQSNASGVSDSDENGHMLWIRSYQYSIKKETCKVHNYFYNLLTIQKYLIGFKTI